MTTTTNWEKEVDEFIKEFYFIHCKPDKRPEFKKLDEAQNWEEHQNFKARTVIGHTADRLKDVFRSLLAQQRSELLDQVEKEVEEAYRRGVETLAWRIDCTTLISELYGWRNILEMAKEEALSSHHQKLSALRLEGGKKK